MKTLLFALAIVIVPVTASGISDRDYRRYRQDNAYQIYSTDQFNKEQIRRMQNRHDRAVRRHYWSRERDKERKHELEMMRLRNKRPVQPVHPVQPPYRPRPPGHQPHPGKTYRH
ncbi:MAG: hypothetical protein U9P36_14295 [Thermodesulfobacteriota bacterium]|nr:hypothetical protein [Thermodesulfobacteriota bacterium]